MASSIVIHVLRPYASEEEYLEHEGSSIGSKSMLLIEQPPLPVDTTVLFEITLSGGQKPIRAEGKVLSYLEAEGDRPGGLRIRFKRFGAATKAFIDRAVALRGEPRPSLLPEAASALHSIVPAAAEAVSPALPAPDAPDAEPAKPDELAAVEASGVHRRVVLPVAVPKDRDALLARLRGRRAS